MIKSHITLAALIVAAGRGLRVGGDIPKQYQDLGGLPVLVRSIRALANHRDIKSTVVVLHADDMDLYNSTVAPHLDGLAVTTVIGGKSRSDSVRNGLAALGQADIDKVLIHDGARPLLSETLIDRIIDKLANHPAVAPALPITDALWRAHNSTVSQTVDRDGLFRAQTPQGFDMNIICAAYEKLTDTAADDVAVARLADVDVTIVAGEDQNIKITRPEDFTRARHLLTGTMDIRTGSGFDVHAFKAGNAVILCGAAVPHAHALKGHSDADVAMHAITDAIYGAVAAGDIGRHFPPSDAKWKDARSEIFLKHAVALAAQMGFKISNMDCTIICEAPKITPFALVMRQNLARISGLDIDRISVKATTSEGLGFTGRGEGIAAQALVTVVRL